MKHIKVYFNTLLKYITFYISVLYPIFLWLTPNIFRAIQTIPIITNCVAMDYTIFIKQLLKGINIHIVLRYKRLILRDLWYMKFYFNCGNGEGLLYIRSIYKPPLAKAPAEGVF